MMLETSGRQAQIENAAVAPPCAMVIFGAAGDLTKRLFRTDALSAACVKVADGTLMIGMCETPCFNDLYYHAEGGFSDAAWAF
jgi:hypothetical protein